MTVHDVAEVAEVVQMLRKLPPEVRKEIYFMIKGALVVSGGTAG